MKIKELKEKRGELFAEVEKLHEERSLEAVEEKLKEIEAVDKEIEIEERMVQLQKQAQGEVKMEKKIETKEMEIREAVKTGAEVEIGLEKRDIYLGAVPGVGAVPGSTTVGNVERKSFGKEVIRKATQTAPIMQYVRQEVIKGLHTIPVEKTKIGKLMPKAELAQFANGQLDFDTVDLKANTYGLLVKVSNEALQDTDVNLMEIIQEQLIESYAETMESLLVAGGANLDGLASFTGGDGSIQMAKTMGELDADVMGALIELQDALKEKYAQKGVFVIGRDLKTKLAKLTDGVGRPLLTTSFEESSFGGLQPVTRLLGCPCLVSDELKSLHDGRNAGKVYFGDLKRALILGMRENMTIAVSKELGFADNSTYIRCMVRFDIAKGLTEALGVLTVNA